MKKIGFIDTSSIVVESITAPKKPSQFEEWFAKRKHLFSTKNPVQTKQKDELLLKSNTDINEENIGEDVLLIDNDGDISKNKELIYKAIISEFEEKGISSSSIYIALQNIPYIDIVEDVVVIYMKRVNLFSQLNIPCINIKKALKKRLNNKKLKIKFVQYKSVSIADYFIGFN